MIVGDCGLAWQCRRSGLDVASLFAFATFSGLTSPALEACRDRFRLCTATARATTTTALVFACSGGLHAAIGAVRALLAFFFLRTRWSFTTRLGDGIGDG